MKRLKGTLRPPWVYYSAVQGLPQFIFCRTAKFPRLGFLSCCWVTAILLFCCCLLRQPFSGPGFSHPELSLASAFWLSFRVPCVQSLLEPGSDGLAWSRSNAAFSCQTSCNAADLFHMFDSGNRANSWAVFCG